MELHSLALARLALNGVQTYSVGDACIVLRVDDGSTASGYGMELRNLMLALFRMYDTEYILKYIQVRIHSVSRSACQHALQKKKIDTPSRKCAQAYLSIFGMLKKFASSASS